MDKKILKIIGGFGNGVYKVTPQMVKYRHHGRMIMLCRQTFLDLCERKGVTNLDLKPMGMEFTYATIKEWMGDGYMSIHKEVEERETILAFLSDEKIKNIYKWLKTQF